MKRLWIKISHLKNSLEDQKTQLRKMFDHTQELRDIHFSMLRNSPTEIWTGRRDGLKECGDLVDENDDPIGECGHIMAGTPIVTQLFNILSIHKHDEAYSR